MQFNWVRETFPESSYHLKFTLTENEAAKFRHKYGIKNSLFFKEFDSTYAAIRLIEETFIGEKVDLGINYKQKYEELEELLKPYRIEKDMEPSTTLKIILKYGKPELTNE